MSLRWDGSKGREHSEIHQPFLILPQESPILLKIRAQFQLPTHCHLVVLLFRFKYHPVFSFLLHRHQLISFEFIIYKICCLIIKSCSTLSGSSVHGISWARTLEWVAISFSEDLDDPEVELTSLLSPALAGGFFTTESLGKSNTLNI